MRSRKTSFIAHNKCFFIVFIAQLPIWLALFHGAAFAMSFSNLINTGKDHFIRGDYDKAQKSYLEALYTALGPKNPADEVDCLIKLGIISWDLGSVSEAKNYFHSGKKRAEAHGLFRSSSYCRSALTIVHLYEEGKRLNDDGKYHLSIRCFKNAIVLAEQIGAEDLKQKCLRSASVVFFFAADYENHYSLARRALIYAQQLGLKREICLCLHGISVNYYYRRMYSEALRNIEMDLEIARELNEPLLEADCYNLIGGILFDLGDYRHAYNYIKKEIELLEHLGQLNAIHSSYGLLGSCLSRQSLENGDLRGVKDGILLLNRAISLARSRNDFRSEASSLNNIGYYYYKIGEYKLALQHLQRACELAELSKDKSIFETKKLALTNIGMIELRENNIKRALKIFTRLAEEKAGDLFQKNLWEAYFGIGLCKERIGDDNGALNYYEKAISLIDSTRKQIGIDLLRASYQRDKLMVHEQIFGLYLRKYKANPFPNNLYRLFMAVERIKARTFLESLLELKNEAGSNKLPTKPQNWPLSFERADLSYCQPPQAEASISKQGTLHERLKKTEDVDVRRLLSRQSLLQKQLDYADLNEDFVLRLQKAVLNDRTAILEYYLGDEISFLFLITKSEFRLYELPPAHSIRESLKPVLKNISQAGDLAKLNQKALYRLGREVLFPIIDNGHTRVDTLIIIPDGFLYYVPFEAINISETGRPIYAVERFRISYAPSSAALIYLLQEQKRKESRKEFLAVGNPTLPTTEKTGNSHSHSIIWREFFLDNTTELKGLPYSEREVSGLARRFPLGTADVLIGEQARESVVKDMALDGYRIIHFACHALLDQDYAFRSALLLAPDELGEEDGYLQVGEIYNLKLNADLVVLSGCQTGRGSLERAEGVFGLPRAFFSAGARAVLCSLWPIQDRVSSVFMQDFYDYLKSGFSASEALQKTKLNMINSKYAHPSYWAAFVLNGDYRPVYSGR